jgi:hypothetical protein
MNILDINIDIDSEVLAALQALESDYQKNGKKWRCPSNPVDPKIRGSGNIIASESLLCFLLPLSSMRDKPGFQKKVFDIANERELRERIEIHLLAHKDRDDFTGHPYTIVIDSDKNSQPFIDSYCFIISLLFLYAEIFGIPESKDTLEHFKFLFRICLDALKNSAIKGSSGRYAGFFVTDKHLPEVPFKYPTWMAIDTLSDLRSLDDISTFPFATKESTETGAILLDSVLRDIGGEYIRIYAENNLTDKERQFLKDRNVDLTKDIVREDPDDNSPHYNLWATIILLYLNYSDSEKLGAAFKVLMPYIDDARKFRNITETACKISFFSDRFPAGDSIAIENVMTDRCFLPQYVKGLSLLLKNISRFRTDEVFLKSLEKSVTELLKNRKNKGALWDRYAENNAHYAVYQTERAIEALCALANLQVALSSGRADTKSQLRSTELLDKDLISAVLRHAIVIQVGENDARSIIAREIASQATTLRNDLIEAVGRLATIVEEGLAQQGKSKKTGSEPSLPAQIKQWAADLKITNT